MSRRRHYIAQPFWTREGRIVPGELHEFVCAIDAEEGGQILARTAAGVLVYQQVIDGEAQLYDEPEVLRIFGEVPKGARSIDPDEWDLAG